MTTCQSFVWDTWSDAPIREQGCVRCGLPNRCRLCGAPHGTHGLIHKRYPQGGGGSNAPCPNQQEG